MHAAWHFIAKLSTHLCSLNWEKEEALF